MILRHNVTIGIRDADGNLLEERRVKNLAVDTGLNLARDLFLGAGYRPDRIKVGTGSSPTTAAMTDLETPVYTQLLDRRVQTAKKATLQMLIGLNDANGYTLAEEGLYQNSILIARALISPPVPKTVSIQVTISHDLEFAAG